jgi:hypothetical protein
MAFIIAECDCHSLKISIVQGDVMALNCDAIICGPPRESNPLAMLFPGFVSPCCDQWGRKFMVPNERCPSEWLKESEAPRIIDAPGGASRLKRIALINTDPQVYYRDAVMAKAVRLAIDLLCLESGCGRIGVVAPLRWHGIAAPIMIGIRHFAEERPNARAQLLLCDRNDPRAYVKRMHHLFEEGVDRWAWHGNMKRGPITGELR